MGAPKGTFPGGVTGLTSSITPESETGLVYDCPILQGSCGRIGNGEGDDIKLFDSERKFAGKFKNPQLHVHVHVC